MTPALDHIFDEVRGAWRFRWIALVSAFVVALIGWAVVFALPDRYSADARVFVDTRTALKPALQGLTIDQNVDAQINYVRQSLLEGPQLEQIAKETGVLPDTITEERARAKILTISAIASFWPCPARAIKVKSAARPGRSTTSIMWMPAASAV